MTIQELIERLSARGYDKEVVIRDAESDALLNISDIEFVDGVVILAGDYSDPFEEGQDENGGY